MSFSGLPEFKIEPLEPLQLADLIISDKIDGKGLKITSHDTKVYGALSFILKRVRFILTIYNKIFQFTQELQSHQTCQKLQDQPGFTKSNLSRSLQSGGPTILPACQWEGKLCRKLQ